MPIFEFTHLKIQSLEIAKNLLSQKIDIKTISAATGLSLADIKALV